MNGIITFIQSSLSAIMVNIMNKRANPALIIFCKAPDPSSVKTRLSPALSDEERLKLYTFLLNRTITALHDIDDTDVYLCYSPRGAESHFLPSGLKLFPQTEGDLGARMERAFNRIFAEGYSCAIITGVDIPEINRDIVKEGFSILADKDLVFGPAHDGGYYLVGMNHLHSEIFEDIPWSSTNTLESSLKRADALGLTYGLTKKLHDLDTPEDLVLYKVLVREALKE